MLGRCEQCRNTRREVIALRIPAEGCIPAHHAMWCGPCLESKLEGVTEALRIAAAQIAVLREEAGYEY